MRFAGRLTLAVASAVMLGAYAWFPMAAFLPWVALVPWIVLYADRRRRPSYGYYFVGAYLAWILQYTQAWKFGWYAPLAQGLVFVPWYLPFAPLLSWLHRRLRVPLPLATGLAWTSVEWLRATFSVSHFDLYGLGYSQARFPMIVQFADVTGVYGVSFLLAVANGLVADWFLTARDAGRLSAFGRARIKWGLCGLGAALVAVSGYGAWRVADAHPGPGPRLALVQPNLPHTPENLIEVHLAQLLMTERRVPAGATDLIVWPENAIMDDIRRKEAYLEDLSVLSRDKGAWFVVGALGRPADQPGHTTNGAWLVDPDGQVQGSYQKRILFPWSEYVPGDELLGHLLPGVQRFHRDLTRLGWGFLPTGVPGHSVEILEFPWSEGTARFSPLICVENAYPPGPGPAGRLGVDFFLNITSEGLVGGPVQEQLLRIAMLRAIENRVAYVRVGNSGISGVIDAAGRPTAILRGDSGDTINTPGVLLAEVPLSGRRATFYARSRDLFARLVVGLTAVLAVVSLVRRRRASTTVLATALALAGCASPPPLEGVVEQVRANLDDGRTLLAAGSPGSAITPLASACATENGCREAIPLLVRAYGMGKTDDTAVIVFEQIATRFPSLRAEAAAARALFLERTHDWNAARLAYMESIAARPTAGAHARLGHLLLRMKRLDDSVATLQAGLAVAPNDARLQYLLGRALMLRGDLDDAEHVLLELVRDHPDQSPAWTTLGWIGIMRGDPDSGRYLERALRADSTSKEARYLMAKTALRHHDWRAVEEMLRQIRQSRH